MTLDEVQMLKQPLIAASAIGRAHRRAGRGSQDAWAAARLDVGGAPVVVAAVADGCSAGRRSEVGAGVGARFAVASAARRAREGLRGGALAESVLGDVVDELDRLCRGWAVDRSDDERQALVAEHLLFTLLVAVVRDERAIVFGVGDGVVSVDGDVRVLDQGPAPDYLGYALLDGLDGKRGTSPRPTLFAGSVQRSIVIGTDGVNELLAREGSLAFFERDEKLVANPSLAQKRLHAWVELDGGPVDDCTLVVVRRAS
jgi:hypothetical protein